MKHTKKFLALVLSLAVVASLAAAGTLAYLSAETTEVENNFTVGTDAGGGVINVRLDEAKVTYNADGNEVVRTTERVKGNNYRNVLPGSMISKDPTIWFAKNDATGADAQSEDCYVYVAVKRGSEHLAFTVNKSLTQINAATAETDGYEVYFYNTKLDATNTSVNVFDGVTVSDTVTNEQLATITGAAAQIKVIAYAVQAANYADGAAALAATQTDVLAWFAGKL